MMRLLAVAALALQATAPAEPDALRQARAHKERRDHRASVSAAQQALAEAEVVHGRASAEAADALELVVQGAVAGDLPVPDLAALADRLVAVRTSLLGPAHPSTIAARNIQHEVLIEQGKLTEAVAAASDLVETLKARGAPAELAPSLSVLAGALYRSGEIKQAVAAREAARAAAVQAFGPDDPRLVEYLRPLAIAEEQLGNPARSLEILLEARRILEPAGRDTFEYGRLLADLSRQKTRSRQLDEAVTLAQASLDTLTAALGDDHPDLEPALSALAFVQGVKGQTGASVATWERLVHILETRDGEESSRLTAALSNLGNAYRRMGDVHRARQTLLRFQARDAQRPRPLYQAQALLDLSILDSQLGRLSDASAGASRALVEFERLHGPDSPRLAPVLERLATIAQAERRLDEAKAYAERCLEVLLKQEPRHEFNVVLARKAVARVARDREAPEARALLEASLQDHLRVMGPDALETATALMDLAGFSLEASRYAEAASYAEKAVGIYEAKAPGHQDLGIALEALAVASGKLGRMEEAAALARRAVAQAEKNGTGENVAYGNAERLLASALARAGRDEEALDAALRSERVRLQTIPLATRHLPEDQALRFVSSRTSTRSLALLLALGQRPRAEEVFDVVLRSRSLLLDGMAARHAARGSAPDVHTQALREAAASAGARYATLAVGGSPATRAELEQARLLKEEAERALAQAAPAATPRNPGAVEVAAALPPGAVLVSIFETWPEKEERPPLLDAEPGDRRYVAFLTGRGGVETLLDLGEARPIDTIIAERLAAQERFARDPTRRRRHAEELDREIGGRLRALIWDPIASRLGPRRTVLWAPDGALAGVNLMSLPARSGGFLVEEGWTFHVLAAERDLLTDATPPGGGVVVLSNVAFGPTGGVRAQGAARGRDGRCGHLFPPLPATHLEGKAVVESMGPRRRRAVRWLEGREASERAVKALEQAPQVLHFATHGFSSGSCGDRDREGEWPGRAGLALAGANQARPGAGDDGILTADEVAALHLAGTDWVVLSACDSTSSGRAPGEGLLGLRRAFQIAGTRTVISSLWPVEDASTARFMTALYRQRFAAKKTTLAAMTAAAQEILRERRSRGESVHPLFWAGFVAAGDWR